MGWCLCGKSNYWPPLVILTLLRKAWRLVINLGQHKLEMFLATGNKSSHRHQKNGFKYFQEIRCSNVKLPMCMGKTKLLSSSGNAIRTELYFPSFFSLQQPCFTFVTEGGQRRMMAICCNDSHKQEEAQEDELLQHAWWQKRSHKQLEQHPTCRETINNGEPTDSALSRWLMKLIKVSTA